MKCKNLMCGLLVSAIILTAAQAGSIWAKRDKNTTMVYSDDTARQIGDVLTIIISESTKIDNKVDRELKKTTDRTSNFDGNLGITTPQHNILPRMPGFTMNAATDNELSGVSNYKDERSFEDRITVVVEDVQTSGNLVVIGTRHRDIADDKQLITISGIVRPSDISFDNTIRSEQVGNFTIVQKNEGYSDTYTGTGWLGKIFDFLWPF
jgi:flagellar L-ring protein precursor FlgH